MKSFRFWLLPCTLHSGKSHRRETIGNDKERKRRKKKGNERRKKRKSLYEVDSLVETPTVGRQSQKVNPSRVATPAGTQMSGSYRSNNRR